MRKSKFIIGIDEVGRGSLAGPVTVAAVLCTSRTHRELERRMFANKKRKKIVPHSRLLGGEYSSLIRDLPLRDSKKLSPRAREAWYAYLKKPSRSPSERGSPGAAGVSYAVSHVRPSTIDKINISNAANLAAYRTFQKLSYKNQIGDLRPAFWRGSPSGRPAIFLDGGLYMRNSIKKTSLLFKSRTVTKGDEKVPAIALASIIAKVRRDALMKRLHKKHMHYGFDVHKGYGTKKHLKAIKKYGLSEAHRTSFC